MIDQQDPELISFIVALYCFIGFFFTIGKSFIGAVSLISSFKSYLKFTILLPFTIAHAFYKKFLNHIVPEKILFTLLVLGINFYMFYNFVRDRYPIEPRNIYFFFGCVVAAFIISLTIIQDYQWRLEVKKALLVFVLLLTVGLVVSAYMGIEVRKFLEPELYKRLHTTLSVIFWGITDASMLFICIDTTKYFEFLKQIVSPATLTSHAPYVVRSVFCTVIASGILYTYFGSIVTTSLGGVGIGLLAYFVFGNKIPPA